MANGSAVRGNGFDPQSAKRWMDELERHHKRLDTLKAEFMNAAKDVRSDIKEVLDLAKDAGIPKATLKDAFKLRQLQQKMDSIIDSGEFEDDETLEQFRHALGDLADTPLGDAAESRKADAAGMPGADSPASLS